MEKTTKLTQSLFLIILVLALLIMLKGFLIPFAYGFLIALIVYPVCKKLEDKRVPRSLSIFISIFLVVLVLGFIIGIFILQVRAFNQEIPGLMARLNQLLPDIQKWIHTHFGLSLVEQDQLVIDMGKNVSSNIGKIITGSFSVAAGALFYLIIIPLYSVLILFYRRTLVDFTAYLMGEKYRQDLPAILSETIHIFFNYIIGMIKVYLIVGILNSIGLLILGVDYAILFGMVTAIMTIIPYVGIIISSVLPIMVVWAETDNILYPLGVIAVFSIVQYLEANIIFPYVVGKQLGINTLISIIAILLGAVIWGVSGMILFLPFIAFLKIIAGHIEGLKPLHKLLDIPPPA